MKTIYVLFDNIKICINAPDKNENQKKYNDTVALDLMDSLYEHGLITKSELELSKEKIL